MSFFGGKNGSGVYHALINLMPPHRVYIEPFLGSGAVMLRKRPAQINIGIDRKLLPSFKNSVLPAVSAEMPVAAASGRNGDAISRSHLAANGERRRRRTAESARGSGGTGPVNPPMLDPHAAEIPMEASSGGNGGAVLHGWNGEAGHPRYEFIEGDGIAFLESYAFEGDELVYCDPPYLMDVRSSNRKRYHHEMGDALEHRRLLRALRKLPCSIMISGYSSVLYSQELREWNAFSFPGVTHGGPRAEWVWCNFARPVELHDYRYLGSNFRERENIQRQKRRWIHRLETMPVLRRQALLAAIAETGISADGGSARRI